MKKIIALVLVALLALSAAAFADTTIKVAASPTPHAIILEKAAELLKDKGITLKITEFTDYVQPNMVVESGEFDANYFQHVPYLNDFNAQNGTHLVSVAEIHYEPFGIYPGKTASFEELADGAQIAVPNDGTNEARALILLEAQGLIKLREGAGMGAIKADIIENPKNLDIVEMEAAQLPRTLNSVDMAVINGNYALQAGLSVTTDAIASEDAESVGAQTYANILGDKEGNENNEAILALVEVLKSEEIKEAILAEYSGSVVPLT